MLYTIGHSTRSLGELVDVLRAFGVTRLVDIRTIPRSRTNPQFNLDVLPDTLDATGISYVQLAALGGRRGKSKTVPADVNAGWRVQAFHNYADHAETPLFEEGLRELLAMASEETCAIMCAEAVWWRCHRRIVTDHVLAHRVPVVHIFSRDKGEPASLTPFARVGAALDVTYPAPHATAPSKTPRISASARAAPPRAAAPASPPRARRARGSARSQARGSGTSAALRGRG